MTTQINQTLVDDNGNVAPASVKLLHDNIMITLHKAYPHLDGTWLLSIDTNGGVIQMKNRLLSGNMGFLLHIASLDAAGKKVRNAAGELLERFRIARDHAVDLRQQMADMKYNNKGEAIYDAE
jgi:hypothetical protein